jgi:hypothetical protein
MKRLANGTQVTALPSPAAPVGTPGYGTNGDPGAGLLGSIWDADQYNRIQEELMAFLTAAGITPDGANNGQVLASLYALFPGLASGGRLAANPGLIKLPGGIILQWVRNLTVAADGSGQISVGWAFPVTFPNAVLGASFTGTVESSFTNTANVVLGAPTLSGYPLAGNGFVPGGTGAVSGFVIGW